MKPTTDKLTSGKDVYASFRDRKAQEFKAASLSSRDIGKIPDVENPARREACRLDFRAFCEAYQPQTYMLAWSDDHRRVISRIEAAVLRGELFAMAMPRGSGKTSLCETAALWALAYGHRRFVVCIGSEAASAGDMLISIRHEIQEELTPFAGDFPEICYPVARKEGIEQRKLLYAGKPLQVSMTADQIILPAIPSSVSASGILRVAGITGRIRGMKYKRKDGTAARPDLVILDDPQTDESARSPSQCANREATVAGAVLGMAGPGKRIAGVMPCTVIRPNDMADNILSRDKHPEWQGERTKMVYSFPADENLWAEYRTLREDGQRDGSGVDAANEFYALRRDAMDAGSVVAWAARKNEDELSAIQHAMNLRFERGDVAFFSEFQNEPINDRGGEDDLTVEQLAERGIGTERGVIPAWASRITAFVDVQQKLLYWLVAAWGEDFGGCVIDYGTYPDQGEQYFTHSAARRTLARELPGAGVEGAIHEGLGSVALYLLGHEWHSETGAAMRIERCLIDANWQTDLIYEFCRRTQFSPVVMPRWGHQIGNAQWTPNRRPGERAGFKWILRRAKDRTIPHVFVEVDGWKSFVASRLQTPIGDKGALTFFGRGDDHRMLLDHLTSETRSRVEGRHGVTDRWTLKPESQGQNHWWDCLVGAAVAASVQGTTFAAVASAPKQRIRRSLAQMQAEAFAKQGRGVG